jgi:hypothetical protein
LSDMAKSAPARAFVSNQSDSAMRHPRRITFAVEFRWAEANDGGRVGVGLCARQYLADRAFWSGFRVFAVLRSENI